MGQAHAWGASEPIAMSWYVAVNTFIHTFSPPAAAPLGALGRRFSDFPAASRSFDRTFGIGPIGLNHLTVGQALS